MAIKGMCYTVMPMMRLDVLSTSRRPEYIFVSMRHLAHPGIAAFIAESLLVHLQARYFVEYLIMVTDTVPRELLENDIVLNVLAELKQQLEPVYDVEAFKVLLDMIDVSRPAYLGTSFSSEIVREASYNCYLARRSPAKQVSFETIV